VTVRNYMCPWLPWIMVDSDLDRQEDRRSRSCFE